MVTVGILDSDRQAAIVLVLQRLGQHPLGSIEHLAQRGHLAVVDHLKPPIDHGISHGAAVVADYLERLAETVRDRLGSRTAGAAGVAWLKLGRRIREGH
jgi:hypothetical protein